MTFSHTASLAGSFPVWEAMVRQAGAISVDDFDELIDLTVAFRFLPKVLGKRVGVIGGGGGPSVIAAEECEESGLEVIPIPQEMRRRTQEPGGLHLGLDQQSRGSVDCRRFGSDRYRYASSHGPTPVLRYPHGQYQRMGL